MIEAKTLFSPKRREKGANQKLSAEYREALVSTQKKQARQQKEQKKAEARQQKEQKKGPRP